MGTRYCSLNLENWDLKIETTDGKVSVQKYAYKELHEKFQKQVQSDLKSFYKGKKVRKIDNRDVVFQIIYSKSKVSHYIPHIEMLVLLKKEKQIEFHNIKAEYIPNSENFRLIKRQSGNNKDDKNTEMGKIEWYHGTGTKFSRIDLSKCYSYADYGRGFYMSEDYSFALKYAKDRTREKGNTPIVYTFVWCNSSLDDLLISNKNKNSFVGEIQDIQNNKYTVKVFNKPTIEWAKYILNGWGGKKTGHWDIIVGPITPFNIQNIVNSYKSLLTKNNKKEEIMLLNKFIGRLDCTTKNGKYLLQLCCNTNKVANNFVRLN